MLISQIADKYDLRGSEVDIFISLIMSNSSLFDLTDSINSKLSLRNAENLNSKEVYSIASIVCKEALGENLMIVAPRMYNNKRDQSALNSEKYKEIKIHDQLLKTLNNTLEDLVCFNESKL